jgi:hypothetical protein
MAASHYSNFDPITAVGALQVEHCDIPMDMTVTEWRAARAASRRAADGDPGRGRRLRRALRLR